MRHVIVGLILLAVGTAARAGFIFFVQPLDAAVYSDMANYVHIADDIIRGSWQRGHFFQPIGYPLVLSAIKLTGLPWPTVLAWTHVFASGLTLALVWAVGAMSFGRRVGLAGLAVAALHLPWILFSSFALPETLFTVALASLALASLRVARSLGVLDAAIWGAVFFAALLLKGTHILVVVFFLLGLLLWRGRRSWKAAVAISLVVWSGLLAHGALTQATIGTFQLTGSAGGLNFVEGKCPIKNNTDSTGASWLSPMYFQLGKTEKKVWDRPFADSGYFFGAGLECIRQNPLVLVQSLEGIPFLFAGNWIWPASNFPFRDWIHIYEMLFSAFAVSGLLICALIALRRGWTGAGVLVWVAPLLGLFACVYIFKSEIRFRVPFDVWIIPLAAKGWSDLLTLTGGRRSTLPAAPAG